MDDNWIYSNWKNSTSSYICCTSFWYVTIPWDPNFQLTVNCEWKPLCVFSSRLFYGPQSLLEVGNVLLHGMLEGWCAIRTNIEDKCILCMIIRWIALKNIELSSAILKWYVGKLAVTSWCLCFLSQKYGFNGRKSNSETETTRFPSRGLVFFSNTWGNCRRWNLHRWIRSCWPSSLGLKGGSCQGVSSRTVMASGFGVKTTR